MSTRIDPVETYYQIVFKKLLHTLPYVVLFILVSQIIIQKLRNYLFAKLNEFLKSVTLLFDCLIESGEAVTSFESRSEIEDIQFEDCKATNSGTCISVDKIVDSFNNAIISTQIANDSMSDVEMLREDSDEETEEKENEKLAENIEVKRTLLQNKRQALSDRLLASKLMEFQEDDPALDTKHSLHLPIPSFVRTQSESPIPIMEEIDISPIPATPASPLQNSLSFFPDVDEFYGFTCGDLLAIAIQASLDDLVAKQGQDSGLAPPQDESSSASLQEQPSNEAGDQVSSATSPSKVNPQQTTPNKRKNTSPQLSPRAVNSLELWENNCPGAEGSSTQQDNSENIDEDFMEGDRYVGDKGKRPQSKRYAYKKRAKPTNSEPEEKNSSDSGEHRTMGQADECCPVITGCLFTLSGLALMVLGLMFLVSGNLVGATFLAFGALCLSFGVFLVRTVCNVNFYSVEDTEEIELENRGLEIMNMTVMSSQGAPIGRIENWGMPQYRGDDREYQL